MRNESHLRQRKKLPEGSFSLCLGNSIDAAIKEMSLRTSAHTGVAIRAPLLHPHRRWRDLIES